MKKLVALLCLAVSLGLAAPSQAFFFETFGIFVAEKLLGAAINAATGQGSLTLQTAGVPWEEIVASIDENTRDAIFDQDVRHAHALIEGARQSVEDAYNPSRSASYPRNKAYLWDHKSYILTNALQEVYVALDLLEQLARWDIASLTYTHGVNVAVIILQELALICPASERGARVEVLNERIESAADAIGPWIYGEQEKLARGRVARAVSYDYPASYGTCWEWFDRANRHPITYTCTRRPNWSASATVEAYIQALIPQVSPQLSALADTVDAWRELEAGAWLPMLPPITTWPLF